MPETSVRELDLDLKSHTKRHIQLLTPQLCQKRVEHGTKIITFLKPDLEERVLVFSDNKDFIVDKQINMSNSMSTEPALLAQCQQCCST